MNAPYLWIYQVASNLPVRERVALTGLNRWWRQRAHPACIVVDCTKTDDWIVLVRIPLHRVRSIKLFGVNPDWHAAVAVLAREFQSTRCILESIEIAGEDEHAIDIDVVLQSFFQVLLDKSDMLRLLRLSMEATLSPTTLELLCSLCLKDCGPSEVWLSLLKNDITPSGTLHARLTQGFLEVDSQLADGGRQWCIFKRRYIQPPPSEISVYKAPLRPGQKGKYLGDHKYVQDRLGDVPIRDCLAVQARYGIQIVAIGRINAGCEWSPNVTTRTERGDTLFYVEVAGAASDGWQRFGEEIVDGMSRTEVSMHTAELTHPRGLPDHLHDCVIGAKEHRGDGNEDRGALYFRNTFAALAIHLITRRNSPRILFPGPREVLQRGDRLFMLQGFAGEDDGRRGPPQLKPDDVEILMNQERFLHHIATLNALRPPDMQVLLARQWANEA